MYNDTSITLGLVKLTKVLKMIWQKCNDTVTVYSHFRVHGSVSIHIDSVSAWIQIETRIWMKSLHTNVL